MRTPLSTLSLESLAGVLAELHEPAWRARQVAEATWQPYVGAFSAMRQLPPAVRDALDERLAFSSVDVVSEQVADGGNTVKLLCRLHDGLTVETVAMESPVRVGGRRRATVCVSSQVGCAVGCPFCATGRMGLSRSCTPAEIVDQVRVAARTLHERGLGPVTHVVYMGMGEPLSNTDATLESVRTLIDAGGMSPRRITVSTSGVVPGIVRLAAAVPGVTLAVSLHAATDDLRDRLVPLNRAYPLARLLGAVREHAAATGRRPTFEWCLIGGVNDSPDQARALRRVAWECHAHVNVIRMNRIEGSPWGPPEATASRAFLEALHGIRVTVRDTRGGDVDAACGQLRAELETRRELRPDGTLTRPRNTAKT